MQPEISSGDGREKPGEGFNCAASSLSTIRWWIGFFIAGLVVSGITAIPLKTEVEWLAQFVGLYAVPAEEWNFFFKWLAVIKTALDETAVKNSVLFYGTDWLAFGHLMLAVVFWGPWRDPVRNIWVIQFGMFACLMVIPWAIIFGAVRGIPFFWRLIDCSFGVIGIIPLWISYRLARRLEASSSPEGVA